MRRHALESVIEKGVKKEKFTRNKHGSLVQFGPLNGYSGLLGIPRELKKITAILVVGPAPVAQ